MHTWLGVCILTSSLARVLAGSVFTLEDEYIGNGFLQGWTYETFDDPTHGNVNYVDQQTAEERGLVEGMSHRLYYLP